MSDSISPGQDSQGSQAERKAGIDIVCGSQVPCGWKLHSKGALGKL